MIQKVIQKIPMRRATFFAIALLFTTHFASACSESTTMMPTTINYPETRRVDIVEEHFGQAIADPYRWLENDVRNDNEIATWIEAQNKVTHAYLDTLPGRDVFRDRLKQLYNYERFSIPVKKGGRYFYLDA
jgi:prolyl oligopeptidase